MGCKFSKTNKVLPVVEPTLVKPATSSPTSPKAKKGLSKGRSGKKTPFVAWDAPTAANIAAFFVIATKQGGGTPIDSVLRAATAVKILADKIFIIALH